jgi:hypothetical protein
MRYVRNSILRAQGQGRNVAALRAIARNANNKVDQIRAVVGSVNVPNGTTQKIAKIVR